MKQPAVKTLTFGSEAYWENIGLLRTLLKLEDDPDVIVIDRSEDVTKVYIAEYPQGEMKSAYPIQED